MKKENMIRVFIFLIGIVLIAAEAKPFLESQHFMPLQVAKKRWGNDPFNAKKFREGDAKARSKMVVSLIETNRFLGRTVHQVREELGRPDGYFWSDRIPAYFIEEGWEQKTDSWQVVLLPGEDGFIQQVRIHRNR